MRGEGNDMHMWWFTVTKFSDDVTVDMHELEQNEFFKFVSE